MKKILIIGFQLIALFIYGQSPTIQIKNSRGIDSIGLNKRIVAIGQHLHTDGSAYDIKTALIDSLHQKNDFRVVISENSFVASILANAYCKQNINFSVDDLSLNYFSNTVMMTQQGRSRLSQVYSHDTLGKSIDYWGVDIFISGDSTISDLCAILKTKLAVINPQKFDNKYINIYKINLEKIYLPQKNDILDDSIMLMSKEIMSVLQANRHSIFSEGDLISNRLLHRMIYNIYQLSYFLKLTKKKNLATYSGIMKYTAYRDSIMAENFIWLADSIFPEKKIIVDVNTLHLIRNSSCPGINDLAHGNKMMGYYLYSHYGSNLFSIAIISIAGNHEKQTGVWGAHTYWDFFNALRIYPKSAEGMISEKYNYETTFVPLNSFLENEYYMRPTFRKFYKCNWSENFDGVIFIYHMNEIR